MHIRDLPTESCDVNKIPIGVLLMLCAALMSSSSALAQEPIAVDVSPPNDALSWLDSEQALVEDQQSDNPASTPHPPDLAPPGLEPVEVTDLEALKWDAAKPPDNPPVVPAPVVSVPVLPEPVLSHTMAPPEPLHRESQPEATPQPLAEPPSVMQLDLSSELQIQWWKPYVQQSLLPRDRWITFNLDQILTDTLDQSPRIQIVTSQASIAVQRVIQEDAAFDTSILFDSSVGRNNDPVGNTLTTGGPDRLIEENLNGTLGFRRRTRRGGEVNLSQDLGLLNSNSTFFLPTNQGNSRLSLSLTQPLLGRRDQVYNERLLLQARIDSRVTWQEMKREVETRLVEVVSEYWRLYELRCHLKQTEQLVNRGEELENFLASRVAFDAGQLDLARVRNRMASRRRQQLVLRADVKKSQSRLAALVGAEVLTAASGHMELIPTQSPELPDIDWDLKAAVRTGLENRPEIRAAASRLESAALSIRVTRAELEPQLNARFDGYLAGLNGNNQAFESFFDQFSTGGPGLSAGLQYERPLKGRAAKARYREARLQFRVRDQELQEVVDQSRAEIEIALIDFQSAAKERRAQLEVLQTALEEEQILSARWYALAADGSTVALALESLLDAQQRRVDAERDLVTAQTGYIVALVQLERAMGTLMTRTGITPVQTTSNDIFFDTGHGGTNQGVRR